MANLIKKIRVFISSPSDVKTERERLRKVVDELNRTIGQHENIYLEIVSWQTHGVPDMGRPQEVINRQIGPYDIFIGIMWKRFGTPTGEADSGTQEEFEIAYDCWKRTNRPRIMFYFNKSPYTLKNKDDIDQLRNVIEFQEELKKKGIIWDFNGPDEFETIMRGHLDNVIRQLALSEITEGLEKKSSQELLDDLRKAIAGAISVIALTVEMRDPYTAGHQRRVANLAKAIAKVMGFSEGRIEGIYMAGCIHDLGKMAVPAEILSKPGKLTEIEFNLIKCHPQIGFDILKNIDFPWPIEDTIFQHHERLNGSGYPSGLSGEKIMVESKILAVADVVEAICSHRTYRPALGVEFALNEISRNKGILYDVSVVDACSSISPNDGFEKLFHISNDPFHRFADKSGSR